MPAEHQSSKKASQHSLQQGTTKDKDKKIDKISGQGLVPKEGITKEEKFPHTQKPPQRRGEGGALEPPREKRNRCLEGKRKRIHLGSLSNSTFQQRKQLTCPSRQLGLDAQAQASGSDPRRRSGLAAIKILWGTRTTQLRESRENHRLARGQRSLLLEHSNYTLPECRTYLCQCHRWDESAAIYKVEKTLQRARGRGQEGQYNLNPRGLQVPPSCEQTQVTAHTFLGD